MTQMTSKTSSPNRHITRPTAKHFPPRTQLPHSITIEPLRGLGTTWYERSVSYWIRRVVVTIIATALVALWTAIVGAIILHSGPVWSPSFIAVLTAEIVLSLVTGVWQFRKILKRPYHWAGKDGTRATRTGVWAGSLGSLIRAGNVLAGALIAILAFVTYGAMLAMFAISLMPELPLEREARQRLAEELEWQGHGAHGPGKHHH